jgi:subtilisin family serine protease
MKKITSLVFIACLVFSTIPVLAESETHSNSSTNIKKVSQKFNSIIQVPNRVTNKQEKATFKFQKDKNKKYKDGEVIVKLKRGYSVNSLGKIKENLGLSQKQELSSNTKLLKFKPKVKMEDVLAALKSSPQVEFAEPNYLIQPTDITNPAAVSDPYFGQLWGMKNIGQTIGGIPGVAGIDIKAETAWSKTNGNSNVVVAVIDTGIDIDHPDLKNRIWKNPGEIPGDKIDNDKNGYVDDVNGWDFYNKDNTVYDYNDGDEHGTHVSGTIAGSADTTGIIGVAPNVKIMPLKFLGPYGGYASDAILAINYAKDKGVKISNNSWGGGSYSQALYDAIKDSNSLFVAAAGNSGSNIDKNPMYPAAYDLPNILSVAAINNQGNLASFSNYGVQSVDIAAPGVSILSSVPGNGYSYYNGTSMATPHASGAAALVLSQNLSASPAVLKDTIIKTVTPLSSLKDVVGTGGLLNAGAAVGFEADNDIPGVSFSGTSKSGTLNSTNDLDDVYSMQLRKGEKVAVTLSGASGTDFDIYLYSPNAKTVKGSDGIVAYSEKSGTSSETFTYIAPEAGTYYLDVYAYKGAGSYTVKVTFGATAGTYENTAKEIGYTGIWNKISNSNASGGSYASANTGGTIAEFVFYGTGVSLKGMKDARQGVAKITIDGISSQVSLYSASTLYKTEYFKKTGLKEGRHVVVIEWTGKAGSGGRKSATNINLDTITVYK